MARLTDQFCIAALIRSLTSGVSEADNLGGAEFLRKLIPTNHPHSSSGRRLTGLSGRSVSVQILTGPCRKPTHDSAQSCNLSG